MSLPSPAPSGDPLDPAAALRQARTRFIAAFDSRCDSIRVLADNVPPGGGPSSVLRQVVHRVAGLAGMVGFPSVSARARELEERVLAGDGAAVVYAGVQRLVDAFAHDRASDLEEWAPAPAGDPPQVMAAAVDGDAGRRLDEALALIGAGVTRVSPDDVVSSAGMDLPDLVVLPSAAPGPDGTPGGAWLRLKTDPITATLPLVVSVPAHGLTTLPPAGALGPLDVVTHAASVGEMAARLRRACGHAHQDAPAPRPPVLAYDVFVLTAREALAQGPAALVLVHGAAARLPRVAALLDAEFRRADLTGALDATHLVLCVPGVPTADVVTRLSAVAARAAAEGAGRVTSGVTAAARGERGLPKLVEAANASLAAALRARVPALASDQPIPDTTRPRVDVVRSGPHAETVARQLEAAGVDAALLEPGAAPRPDPAVAAILVDVSGPAGVALGVLERLARGEAPPVLALVPDAGLMAEAFRLGVRDCIALPADATEIVGRVRHATW